MHHISWYSLILHSSHERFFTFFHIQYGRNSLFSVETGRRILDIKVWFICHCLLTCFIRKTIWLFLFCRLQPYGLQCDIAFNTLFLYYTKLTQCSVEARTKCLTNRDFSSVFFLWICHIFISDSVSKPSWHVLLHQADEVGLLEILT